MIPYKDSRQHCVKHFSFLKYWIYIQQKTLFFLKSKFKFGKFFPLVALKSLILDFESLLHFYEYYFL